MASRIPRQRVLNIKLKENQFVPMTVTNKDRDSFKFSTTHIMQKMLNGNTSIIHPQTSSNASAGQGNGMHNTSNGSISTRNLSLAQLQHNKEAALCAQNQLILQRYHFARMGTTLRTMRLISTAVSQKLLRRSPAWWAINSRGQARRATLSHSIKAG